MPRYEVQVPCKRPVKIGKRWKNRQVNIIIDLNAATPEQAKYFASNVPQFRNNPQCDVDKAVIIEKG